jgi:predicted amidohydrolase
MVNVAAVQMPISNDSVINLNQILKDVRKAAKNEAEIVCFPEISLVSDEKLVRPIGKEIKAISSLAKELNVSVIFGTYLKDENQIKNQIIVINQKGKIIHRYNKKHAYISEKKFLKEGRNNRVFTLNKISCAVINCWDYAYPEYIRSLAKKGAMVIFCPSYLMSHKKTKEVLKKIPQVRAFDSMSYFVMVDAYTKETFKKSRICHPLKELASISDQSGIIYAEIMVKEIKKLRKYFSNV